MNLDDYARKCSKLGIAQIVAKEGYINSTNSSLDVMTDVAQAYVENLGRRAKENCELCGRTEVNLHDVYSVMNEFKINAEILEEYAYGSDLEFLKAIPSFPIPVQSTVKHSHNSDEGSHISPYMPPFPMEHTYSFHERSRDVDDPSTRNERRSKEKQQASQLIEKFSDYLPSGATHHAGSLSPMPLVTHAQKRFTENFAVAQTNMFLKPTTPHTSKPPSPIPMSSNLPATPKAEVEMELDAPKGPE